MTVGFGVVALRMLMPLVSKDCGYSLGIILMLA